MDFRGRGLLYSKGVCCCVVVGGAVFYLTTRPGIGRVDIRGEICCIGMGWDQLLMGVAEWTSDGKGLCIVAGLYVVLA